MYHEHDMDMALTEYMDAIQADYNRWSDTKFAVQDRLNVTINTGSKFYKVVRVSCGKSVHSFVCRKAHDKWKVGDVLKAASWAQPAKNFVRGNVLTQTYLNPVRWTGL
jgi:hypothetical protein